jgi:hypothetical protein
MARKGKMAVLKRQREAKKAEKAALKRDLRDQRAAKKGGETKVADKDDMAGYGFPTDSEPDSEDDSESPPPASPRRSSDASRGSQS